MWKRAYLGPTLYLFFIFVGEGEGVEALASVRTDVSSLDVVAARDCLGVAKLSCGDGDVGLAAVGVFGQLCATVLRAVWGFCGISVNPSLVRIRLSCLRALRGSRRVPRADGKTKSSGSCATRARRAASFSTVQLCRNSRRLPLGPPFGPRSAEFGGSGGC